MIHRTGPTVQAISWQQQLADGFSQPNELLRYLGLDPEQFPSADFAHTLFNLRLPRWFADRMERNNPNDPLLRQFLPLAEELQEAAGFIADPVGDITQSPIPGLLHKYHGRALLVVTGACAVNCRYCFRRHYPYENAVTGHENHAHTMRYLANHSEVKEVILSGGDPLMLSDERLARWLEDLASLPHIKRLRLHTRLPVVLPTRITAQLISDLQQSRLDISWIIHANHPRELSSELHDRLQAARSAQISLLNQSVLLKGVNDCADTLSELSEKLFSLGVLPYYLHQLDRVAGAAHFEVTDSRAIELHNALRSMLPGYLLPRLVREIAGSRSKIELTGGT